MFSPFVIPLAAFAMVVLIVAIVQLAKLREKEMEAQQRLHQAQMEHQRRMQELELELQRVRQAG